MSIPKKRLTDSEFCMLLYPPEVGSGAPVSGHADKHRFERCDDGNRHGSDEEFDGGSNNKTSASLVRVDVSWAVSTCPAYAPYAPPLIKAERNRCARFDTMLIVCSGRLMARRLGWAHGLCGPWPRQKLMLCSLKGAAALNGVYIGYASASTNSECQVNYGNATTKSKESHARTNHGWPYSIVRCCWSVFVVARNKIGNQENDLIGKQVGSRAVVVDASPYGAFIANADGIVNEPPNGEPRVFKPSQSIIYCSHKIRLSNIGGIDNSVLGYSVTLDYRGESTTLESFGEAVASGILDQPFLNIPLRNFRSVMVTEEVAKQRPIKLEWAKSYDIGVSFPVKLCQILRMTSSFILSGKQIRLISVVYLPSDRLTPNVETQARFQMKAWINCTCHTYFRHLAANE